MALIFALWSGAAAASAALRSFREHTPLGPDDEVVLFVDGRAEPGAPAPVRAIEHADRLGFSACADAALALAEEGGRDLVLADAGSALGPGWLDALGRGSRVLTLSTRPSPSGGAAVVGLRLPRTAQAALGRPDRGFRSARGWIADIRLRALAAGLGVRRANGAPVGRDSAASAWGYGERIPHADLDRFAAFWGAELRSLFLVAGDPRQAARDLGVEGLLDRGHHAELVRRYAPPGPDDRRWVRPQQRRLCLHAVVRDGGAAFERGLRSVAGHLDFWIVADAGSADGTPGMVERFFAQRGLPGELYHLSAPSAAAARREALASAKRSPLPYDYLLVMDGDEFLDAGDREFRLGLDAPAYRLRGPDGRWAPRLIGRDTFAGYRAGDCGPLEVRSVAVEDLPGPRLARAAAGGDPGDDASDRRDLDRAGVLAERAERAARGLAGRGSMGAEEGARWHGLLRAAGDLDAAGRGDEAIEAAVEAFELRPDRAEPLRRAADLLRLRGFYDAAAAVAAAGLGSIPPGADSDVADGFREDLAYGAYHSAAPERRAQGLRACDELSRSRSATAERREAARRNLYFYARRLGDIVEGAAFARLDPPLEAGWRAMNPSVALWGGDLWACIRLVNYTLEDSYYSAPTGAPFVTRNLLARLDVDLSIASLSEVLAPADQPAPLSSVALGFEDMRLIPLGGELWCSSSVREMNAEGWCEQVLARIEGARGAGPCRLSRVSRMLTDGPPRHQKNWGAQVVGSELRFIHSYEGSLVVSRTGAPLRRAEDGAAHDHLRGGSQALPFRGGWLTVCHEVVFIGIRRCYLHRFAWFDAETRLARLGEPFRFGAADVEFVAGLAPHPDASRLVVSYGVADSEARLATVPVGEVERLLGFHAGSTEA